MRFSLYGIRALKNLWILSVVLCALSGCQKSLNGSAGDEAKHQLTINFKAVVDNDELVAGKEYHNVFNEPYTVSAFKFYIHAIQLINDGEGAVFELPKDKYYLIDFANSSTMMIEAGVAPDNYNRLAFILGVDSARNVSGAQTDALDPAKGMFWTWNTGYIMAKLEGNSPVAGTPNNSFEYHIGGFRTGENVIQQISLPFSLQGAIDLKAGKSTRVDITANVNAWFHDPNDIRLGSNPVSMTPGPLAVMVSENYRKMFTVVNIVNEP